MSDLGRLIANLPPGQRSIQAKCFHPSGSFVEFKREEIEQSIPSRFERQVAKYPDRVAVKTRNHTLTYYELNEAANRVARAILARSGDGSEPIALLIENDAPIVVAILGVLKAGRIYVPLDPLYPHARLTYILEDSQAGLIVTNTRNLTLARELAYERLQVVNVDEIASSPSPCNPKLNISPDRPANILYTSGSTGQPKGVVQNHRNVLHEIMNYTNGVHICANDRLILLSSPSFADAVRTTYGSLLNGAGLYPFDIREEGLDHLADWMIQQGITIYRSVPAVLRHFVSSLSGNEKFTDLRLIYSAGDSVSKADVQLYKRYFSPTCVFVNGLGSTESLTFRWYFIDQETQMTGSTVPVGYALEGMEVLLLENDVNEPGSNEVGEIAVKSRYLSPGYWRKPELTGAVFSADLAGGDRIYRTGDLGRILSDGCLEHLGRKDFQVKIRGHRIEVTEVEMALLDLDTIKEAVVVARKDDSGDQRLVAYVVPHNQPGPTVTSLRHVLRGRLPDYMIPSAFMVLDALPLTPNRKLDRKALPDPGKSRPKLDAPYVAPRTPIEEALAEIWAEVLSLDEVGIHDNFFELGGHSLAASQVISRVIKRLQLGLPVQSLFQAPTVAEMAAVITQSQAENLGEKKLEQLLAELESLSDDEAQVLVKKASSHPRGSRD
jgi:amino acid adenylation domain-containing protein